MDSDVPKKMLGLFNAFKSYVAKTKRPESQLSDNNDCEASTSNLQVIKRTGDIAAFDAERISVAISKAFLAIEGRERHIDILTDRVSHLIIQTSEQLDKIFNCYFRSALFSIEGALKLTAASQAIAIFKKLKEITPSIIFTSTRNFSIQKNLSISA